MSCYNTHYGQYGQPPATVNQMAPIQEVNPRLLEAALSQLQRQQQTPMSQTNGISIINAPSTDPIHAATIPQDVINQRAMQDGLNQQDLIAQQAAAVLRAQLGYDPYFYDVGAYYRPQ